jgi:hypothetical protein
MPHQFDRATCRNPTVAVNSIGGFSPQIVPDFASLFVMPHSLFRILSDHDAPNIQGVRLTHVFHFFCVFASGNLRGVLGGKAAISFQEFAGV